MRQASAVEGLGGGRGRQSSRMPFLRPVHIRVLGEPGAARRLFSANLSTGGIFIRTPQPPAEGTSVEILLEAKGRALPFAKGEVVFALKAHTARGKGRLPGFGVRFTKLPTRSWQLVRHLGTLHAAKAPVDSSAATLKRPLVERAVRGRRGVWATSAVIGLALMGGLFWHQLTPLFRTVERAFDAPRAER